MYVLLFPEAVVVTVLPFTLRYSNSYPVFGVIVIVRLVPLGYGLVAPLPEVTCALPCADSLAWLAEIV